MSRTKWMAVAVAATVLMTGCSKEDNQPQGDNERALKVTGGIQALTRAHDATWEANDAIGIFMFSAGTTTISEEAENRKYTTATGNGSFSPATADQNIFFPITGKTDFVAYYPWQSITKGAGDKYLYAVDVTNQTIQKNIDLMAATKVVDKDKDNKDVAFQFTHKLTKIALTEIKNGEGLTADDLKEMSVKLTDQYTKATYDVVAGGEVAVNTSEPKADISLLVADNGTSAEAIVLPTVSTSDMALVFTLKNGNTYSWELKNATQSTEFKTAHKYSYKITISKKGLSVTSTITDWVAGNGADGEEGTAE